MARNSANIEFDLSAVKDLTDTLEGIATDVRATVIAEMVTEGAKPVVRSIKSKVPVRFGNLKESITAAVRVKKKTGTALAVIGPEVGGRFKNGKRLNRKKDDLSGSEQPSRYAHLIEFGHRARNASATFADRKTVKWTKAQIADANAKGSTLPSAGRRVMANVPAKPFMRPGTNEAQGNCAAMMLVGFEKGLVKAAKKHAKSIK